MEKKYLRLAFSIVHNTTPTQISIPLFHHTRPNLYPIQRIPEHAHASVFTHLFPTWHSCPMIVKIRSIL